MKKSIYVIFIIAVTFLVAFSFSSCKGKSITLTFDGNGGSLVSGTEIQTVKEGDSVTPPTYERAGYTLSWGDFSLDKVTESATVKAVWTPIVYTINYALDGGTNHVDNPATYTVESDTITLKAPTKDNHVFAGFSEGNTIAAKSIGNKTFTALWTPNQYTYTFFDEDGTTVLKTATLDYGSEIIPPDAPQKDSTAQYNYTFNGWDKSIPDTLTANITFTAKYSSAINQHTYTFFEEDGVTIIKTKTVDYGSTIIPPETPPKVTPQYTYTFISWDKEIPNTLTANIVFIAEYSRVVNKYTYIFFDDDRITILKTDTVDYGSAIIPPLDPFKDATPQYTYTFNGWNKSIPNALLGNITFTAKYSSTINQYTYTFFEEDGITIIKTKTVDYGSTIIPPSTPLKVTPEYTYTFITWDKIVPEVITENINFIAEYSAKLNSYTVSFETDGGDTLADFIGDYGTKVQRPDDPAKEDTVFLGWYKDVYNTDIYDFDTLITSDITLYARWAEFYYNLLDDETGYEVAGFKDFANAETIVIPSIHKGLPVTGIGYYGLCNKDTLRQVTIREGIKFIEEGAFSDCSNLTSITLPSSLESIGAYAFAACALESIVIPEGITAISVGLFRTTESLKSITLPSTLLTIGKYSFDRTGLESITIPSSVIEIGEQAFFSCSSLVSAYISTVTLGNAAFTWCTKLETVTLSSNLETIGNNVFTACEKLTSILLPYGLTSIGNEAFSSTGLTEITIPGSVKSLGESSFAHNSSLALVTFENGIESIDKFAFYNSKLTSVILPDSIKTLGVQAFSHSSKLTMAVIGSGIENISDNVFTSAMRIVSIKAVVPPTCGTTPFGQGLVSVFVPAASVDQYKSVPQLSYCSPLIFAMPSVTFNTKGGNIIPTAADLLYGETIQAPEAPERIHGVFDGWFADEEYLTPYYFGTPVTGTITIYAKWIMDQFTYTFYDEDGTSVLKSATVDYGSAIVPPTNPSKPATVQYTYIFNGWDKEVPDSLTGDITFFATYLAVLNQYTYTFFDEDGTTELKSVTADYGSQIVPPNNPTKPATVQYTYTFSGWDKEIPVELTDNIYFVAQFSQTINQYTYIFLNYDSTELKRATADYGTEILPPANPTKAATAEFTFTFSGWDKEIPAMLTADIQFVALYTETLNKYTYTFYDDDEITVLKTVTADYGSQIVPPEAPTKATTAEYSFSFSGWDKVIPTSLSADIDFTAQYVQTPIEYNITFYSNGGSDIEPIIKAFGTDMSTLEIPLREGHTFSGWYMDNGTFLIACPDKMPAQNINLYTKWTANKNVVNFDANGGSGTMAPQLISIGSATALNPNTFSKSGYYFEGWATDEHSETVYADRAVYSMGLSVSTLYAVWKPCTNTNEFLFEAIGEDAYVIRSYYGSETFVAIPGEYNGKPVTSILSNAFNNKQPIQTVVLPNTIRNIDYGAFENCIGLTSINLPEGLISIGRYSFSNCNKLAGIYLPSTLTSIGYKAFAYCAKLKSVVIPDSVTSLGANSFETTGVISATVGSGVTDIPDGVFASCYNLNVVTIRCVQPPTLFWAAFYGCPLTAIYVPEGSVNAYKSADEWNNSMFVDKFVAIGSFAFTVQFDNQDGSSGMSISAPAACTITAPISPLSSGKIFVGWYKDTGYTNLWNFDTDTVLSNITLYAKWQTIT